MSYDKDGNKCKNEAQDNLFAFTFKENEKKY